MAKAMLNARNRASMIMPSCLYEMPRSGQRAWSDHVPVSPGWVGPAKSHANAGSIRGPRDAFVHEGEWIPLLHVSGVELFDVKSRRRDEIIDLAVEMAAPAEAFPKRCQPMLPPCHAAVGREPMLHEQQAAIRAKDAAYFAKRRDEPR
jgi:hypothetical protein